MTDSDVRLISVLIPVLNEAENVDAAYERVRTVFEGMSGFDFEIVFTDNHSTDETFERIAAIANRDSRVRAFRFSRNFGFQRSILEGYRRSRGDAAVQLDCDMQDPPELIPQFVELWTAGNDVVYGIRTARQEAWHLTVLRRVFYRLAAWLSEDDLQLDAGDFRLVDRRVLDAASGLNDAQPYLRGAIASIGFRQVGVTYERAAREHGRSKFSLGDLVALSIDGILNHSTVPLRLATYTGLIVSGVTFIALVAYLVARLAFGRQWPPGFATTTSLILISLGLNALFLGIIGEYLGRIYKQVKHTYNVVVEQAIDPSASSAPGH